MPTEEPARAALRAWLLALAAFAGCTGTCASHPSERRAERGTERGEAEDAGESAPPLADEPEAEGGAPSARDEGGASGEGGEAREGGAGGAPGEAPGPALPVPSALCEEGFLGVDEGACFYVPAGVEPPGKVLHFAHGMMPPNASPAAQQARLREAAEALGFVAIFTRGEPGLCTFRESVLDWLCWPTSREAVDEHAEAIVLRWLDVEKAVAGHLGASFERRYLAGFSNGGYFVTYLALEGLIEADGALVVGAGRNQLEEPPLVGPLPVHVVVGQKEAPSVLSGAENLASYLEEHGWPHALDVQPGRAHELRASDFLDAWLLWAPN